MSFVNVVGVQFHKAGKIYDFSSGSLTLKIGDPVVVDTERGASLAKVVTVKYLDDGQYEKNSLKRVIRMAAAKDLDPAGKLTDEYVLKYTRDKVNGLELEMRILKSEIQFSGNKVIIYFTAPGRIDFRDLVKELATGLKSRVELKQVGSRDEAKLIGGLGICGREFCCSSFLREFVPVSIKMAKNQNLALNPTKISGGCGRLLCCLTYENDTYTDLKKTMPPLRKTVEVISEGQTGTVVRADFLNQMVLIRFEEGDEEEFPVSDVKLVEAPAAAKPAATSPRKEEAEEWAEGIDLDLLAEAGDQGNKSEPKGQKPQKGKQGKGPRNRPNNKNKKPRNNKKN